LATIGKIVISFHSFDMEAHLVPVNPCAFVFVSDEETARHVRLCSQGVEIFSFVETVLATASLLGRSAGYASLMALLDKHVQAGQQQHANHSVTPRDLR